MKLIGDEACIEIRGRRDHPTEDVNRHGMFDLITRDLSGNGQWNQGKPRGEGCHQNWRNPFNTSANNQFRSERNTFFLFKVLEVEDIILCAKLSSTASLERKESRWGFWHYRADFPKKDDENWRKHIMLRKGADPAEIRVSHRPITGMQ